MILGRNELNGNKKDGFTLIEVSIVLVIVALLAAGVRGSPTTHLMHIGGPIISHQVTLTFQPMFNAIETYSMDAKFDDGLANNGKFRTRATNTELGTTCTTGVEPDYSYDFSREDGICTPIYLSVP